MRIDSGHCWGIVGRLSRSKTAGGNPRWRRMSWECPAYVWAQFYACACSVLCLRSLSCHLDCQSRRRDVCTVWHAGPKQAHWRRYWESRLAHSHGKDACLILSDRRGLAYSGRCDPSRGGQQGESLHYPSYICLPIFECSLFASLKLEVSV